MTNRNESDDELALLLKSRHLKQKFERVKKSVRTAFKGCALAVFDFDGVFTDNKVYVHEDGHEAVGADRSDVYGLRQLENHAGVQFLILSREANRVVGRRAKKLEIECLQALENKAATLREVMVRRGLKPAQVLYVGNDMNDLACLTLVGLPIAVADAYPPIREFVKKEGGYITSAGGGNGAVREVLEMLLMAKLSK